MDTKVPESSDKKVIYHDAITKEDEERITRKFPFSQGTPHWVHNILQESNNIDRPEDVIRSFNSGGEIIDPRGDQEQSHVQKVSFMTIHDIGIT